MNDGDTFVRQGLRFKVRIKPDDCAEAPWEREDGHGPVRTVRSYYRPPTKRAGERVLHNSRDTYWLYDWQAACRLARKDGWNAEPFDASNRIQRAVQADFDRLRRWLNNDWCYVGVVVELLDADGNGEEASIWGVESDYEDYITELAEELADEIIYLRLEAWHAALTERRETRNLQRMATIMAGVLV